MRKTAVVYWSGTGNTQMMAEKVAEGVRAAGAEADVYNCTEFSADLMDNYEAVAFGCPSMGSEQLEDTEFEPVFTECEAKLSGKVIGLFGSYGWGDGQWMRDWCERAKEDGAVLFSEEGLICNETPDDDAQAACRKLGADLAAW
jgi:flavodoxin